MAGGDAHKGPVRPAVPSELDRAEKYDCREGKTVELYIKLGLNTRQLSLQQIKQQLTRSTQSKRTIPHPAPRRVRPAKTVPGRLECLLFVTPGQLFV